MCQLHCGSCSRWIEHDQASTCVLYKYHFWAGHIHRSCVLFDSLTACLYASMIYVHSRQCGPCRGVNFSGHWTCEPRHQLFNSKGSWRGVRRSTAWSSVEPLGVYMPLWRFQSMFWPPATTCLCSRWLVAFTVFYAWPLNSAQVRLFSVIAQKLTCKETNICFNCKYSRVQ